MKIEKIIFTEDLLLTPHGVRCLIKENKKVNLKEYFIKKIDSNYSELETIKGIKKYHLKRNAVIEEILNVLKTIKQ